jgi:2-polyprenyl-6-methoxyphenol hydroxylase-like FAD-dependent oxidoreductase
MKETRIHALIIGSGIADPALSLFLKKAGISSTVYEAYPYMQGVGGGLSLAPNGMNVLEELDLAEKLKTHSTVVLESCFRSETGRILARIDNGSKKYGQPVVALRRSDLHEVLTQEMGRQAIAVTYEKRLIDIRYTSDNKKVVAHFADGSHAEGDILIGADGIHSQTRKTVLPEIPDPPYVGIIGIGGSVPLSAVPNLSDRDRHNLNFTFGHRGFCGYCGARPDELIWWSNLWREKELTKEELNGSIHRDGQTRDAIHILWVSRADLNAPRADRPAGQVEHLRRPGISCLAQRPRRCDW